ncbi:MAG: TIGR00730 family Rossman fold protein [Planctomycetota bacterium]|nr:TIGR00730 family Rossman fold protein [Planctomycetota bacterium]MDG1984220.1 TIGR00730 family Rossman fold protein [Planctomycetota bacterium]
MSTRPSDGQPAPRRICVFCASSTGSSPEYGELATQVGRTLAERGYGVVYGGANRGLMGKVADAALEAGGEVLGVLPYGLQAMEVAHENLTSLEIVDTLHERKARMMELSSGFLVLPGGHGTLEEFFEVLTWLQLAIHDHPVGVLNHAGFYDHIFAHLDHVVAEGLLRPEHRALLLDDPSLDGILDAMEAYQSPPRPEWATRPQP